MPKRTGSGRNDPIDKVPGGSGKGNSEGRGGGRGSAAANPGNRVVDTSKMTKGQRANVKANNKAVKTYLIKDEAASRAANKAAETRRINQEERERKIAQRSGKIGLGVGTAGGVGGSMIANSILNNNNKKKPTQSNGGKNTGRTRSEYPRSSRGK